MRMTQAEFNAVHRGFARCGDQLGFLLFERDLILTGCHPDKKATLQDGHVKATETEIEAAMDSWKGVSCDF